MTGPTPTPDDTEALAEALCDHFWIASDKALCSCGWQPDNYQDRLNDWTDGRDDVWLDTIAAAMYAKHVAGHLAPIVADAVTAARAEAERAVEALNEYLDNPPLPLGHNVVADAQAAETAAREHAVYAGREVERLQEALAEAEEAAAEGDALRARVEAVTYASDDGTEYEHNDDRHGPECPGCWVQTIRAALTSGDQ